MSKEHKCKKCKRIILAKGIKKFLEENPRTFWLQCPYCFELERIK